LPQTALGSPADGPSSGKENNNFAPAAPLSPDLFDGFPTPKGFDTKPGLVYTSQQQQQQQRNNTNTNPSLQDSLSNAWLPSNQDDDSAISFPSLPDPSLAASSASKAAARGDLLNVPPPPTPPLTEELVLQQPLPTILDTGIPAPPISAEKDKSLERKTSTSKKKKKKRNKSQKAGKKESSNRDVHTAEPPKKILLTAEILAEQMAHEQRPEDTPEPSSLSGMRFDELYRLRGVVRIHC
jgi:hypothetical protein